MGKSDDVNSRLGRPAKITYDDVVTAGLAVGLEALTMKAVAERLNVTTGALYHHVQDLDELRTAVGEHVVQTIEFDGPGTSATDDLVRIGLTLRALEHRHPGIGAFLATADGSEITQHMMSQAVARIEQREIAPADARMTTSIVANVAFAFASRELTQPTAQPNQNQQLLTWVLRNLASSLLADLRSAPWNDVGTQR